MEINSSKLKSAIGMVFVFAFALTTASPLRAEIELGAVFTDNMVLQRLQPVRVWGTAAPGENVTVKFAGQAVSADADLKGEWMVELAAMPANENGQSMTVTGANTQPIRCDDVLIGEVWIAGGQSNMASEMHRYLPTVQPDIDTAQDPLLRMISIPVFEEGEKQSTGATWKLTTPTNVIDFSASGYYFAKHLRESLNVPVGIIKCCVGASAAEAWISREVLTNDPNLRCVVESYDNFLASEFNGQEHLIDQIEDPIKKRKINLAPRKRPCRLYEEMLTQVIPASVAGVIWYQGEANANENAGFHYRKVFSALIELWRKDFRNPNLPFLFVQLATFSGKKGSWPELRESQQWIEDNVLNTAMVVLVDGGDLKNIHPHSKNKVGARLASFARKLVYGETDLVCHGPKLESIERVDNQLSLRFDDPTDTLVLKNLPSTAFEICGTDGVFVPAQAVQVGKTITLSAQGVVRPIHARYGWKGWFVPTLFNEKGLPAGPFRTDDFKRSSANRFYLQRLQKLTKKKAVESE